jgi:hypothetical protein
VSVFGFVSNSRRNEKNKQMGLQPSSEQQQNFKAFTGIGECPSSTADECSRKAHDRGSDSASNSN